MESLSTAYFKTNIIGLMASMRSWVFMRIFMAAGTLVMGAYVVAVHLLRFLGDYK